MKYSIVVPIYNVQPYLKECVDSVINQTYLNWELILVDDGSPDGCPQMCDEYSQKDERIKVIHKTNGGLVSARKAGAEIVTGDYVLCLDGDDYISNICLQTVNNLITVYQPDVICYGNYKYKNIAKEDNSIIKYKEGFYNRERLEKEILPIFISDENGSRFPANLWGKVFKKELYLRHQNKVSSAISMGEDVACTYPLIYNAESMYILHEPMYYYRIVGDSMTKVRKPLSWENYDLLDRYLHETIDLGQYSTNTQLARLRTHNLFNITCSQFRGKSYNKKIVTQIKQQYFNHNEYNIIIHSANFKNPAFQLMRFIIQHKLFFVCYLYCKLHD